MSAADTGPRGDGSFMAPGFPGRRAVNDRFDSRWPGTSCSMTSSIVPSPDGPLIVRGDFQLLTPDGEPIEPNRGTVALCRCGKSAIKPFCDGTHKVIKFRAGTNRDSPRSR